METYLSSFPGGGRWWLNEEVIANILSFLPAKVIAKVKFLNRRVRRLTSADYFVLLQSRRAGAADSGFFSAYKYGANIFFFAADQAGIPADSSRFLKSAATILSSANGLVIYFDRTLQAPDGIAVCNPVRGTSLSVPQPPGTELSHDRFVGVGAVVCKDGRSFDYKLVHAEPAAEWGADLCCRIYDSRDGEWNAGAIAGGAAARNLRLDEPVVCGSAVFWASTCGAYMRGVDPYVVALDVGAAAAPPSSRIVPLPADAVAAGSPDDYEIRIARWDETGPCLIQYRRPTSVFALWSLATAKTNEEGAAAATAWRKIGEVGFEEMKMRRRQQVGSFTLINRDILVFITVQRRLYSYSLSSRQLKKLGRVDSPYSALIPYANTLRPCSRDNKADVLNFF